MSDQNIATETPLFTRAPSKRRWPWLIGTLCLVIVFLSLAIPAAIWDGMAQRTIRIRVVDNSTGYSVSGATVTLMQARDYAITEHLDPVAVTEMLQHSHHQATTNEHGEATVMGQFRAGGGSSFLWLSGAFHAEGLLTISHPKYQTTEGLLQNYLQRKEFPIRTKSLDVHLFLVPK